MSSLQGAWSSADLIAATRALIGADFTACALLSCSTHLKDTWWVCRHHDAVLILSSIPFQFAQYVSISCKSCIKLAGVSVVIGIPPCVLCRSPPAGVVVCTLA